LRSSKRTWLIAAAAAAATLVLWVVSKGKWSDPLIDSGREWIVPDALSRGELLYRDVVYWFGPLTPYWHAFVFRLFGSGFGMLALAGVLGAVAVCLALYFALRRVTDPVQSALWTALAVPALVFMPNAGGAILGMGYRMWHAAAMALLAVTLASSGEPGASRRRFVVAGALAGLSGLCRTEWGVIALIGSAVAVYWRPARLPQPHRAALRLIFGFLLAFGLPIGLFLWLAGPEALLRESPVLLLGLPTETRAHVVGAGLKAWREGVWSLVYGAALAVALYWLVEIVALERSEPARARRRLAWLGALAAALALGAIALGFPAAVVWSGAPAICAIACIVAIARRRSRSVALLPFGLTGLLLHHRRPFFITDAPYVAPPLLFSFVCAAGLITVLMENEEMQRRSRLRNAFAGAVAALIVAAFAARIAQYREDRRVPVAGTDGMLSAQPHLAGEIEELAAQVRGDTMAEDGLVVFPEGEVLNFLTQRRNPLRHKLYIPGYLTEANEAEILEELTRRRPRAIILWRRPAGEYGRGLFGLDYGGRLMEWIEGHYERRSVAAEARRSEASQRFTYLLLREAARVP
jgi:hypothetical protein